MTYSKEIYNAIEKKDLKYLKYLIKNNKIDLSYNNNSFIKKASECSSIEIFKYLISFPEVDYTYFNWTFKSACLNGNYDIVDFLLNDSKINIFAEEHFAIKMAASNNHFEHKPGAFSHALAVSQA